jgi:hypothetical protein
MEALIRSGDWRTRAAMASLYVCFSAASRRHGGKVDWAGYQGRSPWLVSPPFSLWKFGLPIIGAWGIGDTKAIENFQSSWNISSGGAFAEIRFGSQCGEFLSDRNVDELIKRDILRVCNTSQFL